MVLALLALLGHWASDGRLPDPGSADRAGARQAPADGAGAPEVGPSSEPDSPMPPPPVDPPVAPSPQPPPAATPSGDPLVPGARDALPTLAVKGRAPRTGYSRDEFGQAWSDDVSVEFGHNGCDTRNDILRRDLTDVVVQPGTQDCVVLSGALVGPYTREHIDFVRGARTSSRVQIDHVVALGDAWQKGAQQLEADARRNLANDPLNLLAVDGSVNASKRDGDAATWLPPSLPFRCGYVARQVLVKQRYGLWVTPAEHDAIAGILAAC